MTKYVNNVKCFARLWALRAIPSVKISNVCKPHTYLVALNWAYSKKHRVTEGNGIEADQLLSFLGGRGSIPGKGPGRGNRKKRIK